MPGGEIQVMIPLMFPSAAMAGIQKKIDAYILSDEEYAC